MLSNSHEFMREYTKKMQSLLGKSVREASAHDCYIALADMVKEELNRRWAQTNCQYMANKDKQVFYFSMEFLIGRLLDIYLLYTGWKEVCREGLAALGIDFEDVIRQEPEAGLGNGGLGRLAACFLDSMASLGIPGHGCGIRYKYGLFLQKIVDGFQVELPDNWLRNDNVWEIRRADKAVEVRFGGQVRSETANGRLVFIHENYEPVLAVPYDIPIAGFHTRNVNTLRLWNAEPVRTEFDFSSFSRGDYEKALENRNTIEAITEVLYPDDSNYNNRVLRLKQEYFLVSAGVQSVMRRFRKMNLDIRQLPDKVAIHINDTHPALAIPELMRILLDEEGVDWDTGWDLTTRTISYTNHTIMPEALEKWPVDILQTMLPRIFLIIQEINERFCRHLWQLRPGDWDWISGLSIVADGYVRMAYLSITGSHSVNGVAEIHTEILKKELLKDFYQLTPFKFSNKTNGIAHRRWLMKANEPLTRLITEAIGDSWIYHPSDLIRLVKAGLEKDPAFQDSFSLARKQAKRKLARYIRDKQGIAVDEDAIFDVQVKRFHGYKRQLLNALRILCDYNRLRENRTDSYTPRVFLFSGKAAPSYYYAKKIIKLVCSIADVVNRDPLVSDKMKVVFLENYSVSLAELILPAADVSEQISTASKEASGTGNMKFMMNGAITLGTMDGANIEIADAIGSEHMISFGLSVEQVLDYYRTGGYCSTEYYWGDERIRKVVDQLTNGFFTALSGNEFSDIARSLLEYNDPFFVLRDFDDYLKAQQRLETLYASSRAWLKTAIINTACSGRFGSDDTVNRYAESIWNTRRTTIADVPEL